jgi:twitching motility protein PilI
MAARASLRDYQRDLAERLRQARSVASVSKLGLEVAGEAWLVNLGEAGQVIPLPAVSPVPLTKPWFRGVANIRGSLCSVVDFAAFLGHGPVPAAEEARLVILGEHYRMGAGLLVNRSLGLRSPAELQPMERPAAPWVRAQYGDAQGREWKELDVPALVRHPGFLDIGI